MRTAIVVYNETKTGNCISTINELLFMIVEDIFDDFLEKIDDVFDLLSSLTL